MVAAIGAGLSGGCVVMDEETKRDGDAPPQSQTVTFSDPETDTGGSATELPEVSVTWGGEAVSFAVSDGGTWRLGMAETGGSCGADIPCWTGEDCHLGYTATDGTLYGPYCHAISDGQLELTYGGDLADLQPGTTVFQEAFLGTVTYVVLPADPDLPCLVFGDDVQYYDSLGCVALSL